MLAAGVDEAGRGCIFGPVCAGAVIWNPEITHEKLKDSKKLTKRQRDFMYDFVIENAIDFAVGWCSAQEIDEMNILNASQEAMHRALDGLNLDIDHVYVDGNIFKPYQCKTHECIVGGDNINPSISAASIIAKVSRDRWVDETVANNDNLAVYVLSKNKGYCTSQHIEAVKSHGRSEMHRKTFKLPFEKVA